MTLQLKESETPNQTATPYAKQARPWLLAEAEGITLHQAGGAAAAAAAALLCSKHGCFLSIASLQRSNGTGRHASRGP